MKVYYLSFIFLTVLCFGVQGEASAQSRIDSHHHYHHHHHSHRSHRHQSKRSRVQFYVGTAPTAAAYVAPAPVVAYVPQYYSTVPACPVAAVPAPVVHYSQPAVIPAAPVQYYQARPAASWNLGFSIGL